jgi:hypothetical protein
VDASQALSPVILIISQEQSVHGGRDRSYSWMQQPGFLLTNIDLNVATTECPIFQQLKTTLNTQYGTISQGGQSVTLRQVDYNGLLPLWKGKYLCLLEWMLWIWIFLT